MGTIENHDGVLELNGHCYPATGLYGIVIGSGLSDLSAVADLAEPGEDLGEARDRLDMLVTDFQSECTKESGLGSQKVYLVGFTGALEDFYEGTQIPFGNEVTDALTDEVIETALFIAARGVQPALAARRAAEKHGLDLASLLRGYKSQFSDVEEMVLGLVEYGIVNSTEWLIKIAANANVDLDDDSVDEISRKLNLNGLADELMNPTSDDPFAVAEEDDEGNLHAFWIL